MGTPNFSQARQKYEYLEIYLWLASEGDRGEGWETSYGTEHLTCVACANSE